MRRSCRREISAAADPSMWSGDVKIQIENHLANLPVVPSVNKFWFTRVAEGYVMDPGPGRLSASHKSEYARPCVRAPRARESPRNISIGIGTDLFIARSSGTRARNIRPCNLLERR